jgi:hypothetical protein
MVYFHTKNPDLEGLEMENVAIDNILRYTLWPFGIVCVHFVYFPILVCLDQEKKPAPGANLTTSEFTTTAPA